VAKLENKIVAGTWRNMHNLVSAMGGLADLAGDLDIAKQVYQEYEDVVAETAHLHVGLEAVKAEVRKVEDKLETLDTRLEEECKRVWGEKSAEAQARYNKERDEHLSHLAKVEAKKRQVEQEIEELEARRAACAATAEEAHRAGVLAKSDLEQTQKQLRAIKENL